MAVRRFRARARLSALLGGVAAYIALLLRRLRAAAGSSGARMALVSAVAVLAVDGGLVFHSHPHPKSDHGAPSGPTVGSLVSRPARWGREVDDDATASPAPAPSSLAGTAVRRSSSDQPRADPPIVPAPREKVHLFTPLSDRATQVDTRPREEQDHLVCVGYGPILPKTCVG